MKILNKFIDSILFIFVGIVLVAAVTSAIWNKPMLFSAVRSNSMYPLFQRGDMIIINSLSEKDKVTVGDIVVFKSEEGSLSTKGYVVHRIVEDDGNGNFYTKGDANDYKDPLLKREWIYSKVITIGKLPLKIPLIGYLPLWVEQFQANQYAMPIIAIIIAIIVAISELANNKKGKKKKKSGLDMQLIYFFSGLTITVVMASTMIATSQRIVLPYEVSANSDGVIMGSSIGIIKIGEERELPLSDLSNKGFIPIIATTTSNDMQITFSDPLLSLRPGYEIKTVIKLKASKVGKYETVIHVGMFYPFLPKNIIYALANKNYWMALLLISLIPGLPLILYPMIDAKMRNKTIKEIRRSIRRIKSIFIFN